MSNRNLSIIFKKEVASPEFPEIGETKDELRS
jgi:hypothetical protein